MKEFRWEKAAQFNFPFEAAALNFIVTFFREHIQCIKSLCFKIPGVYKIILVMRAVFNFVRHPLLGVLPSAWVLLFFFLLSCCATVQLTWGCGAEHHVLQFVLLCSFLREREKDNCWICILSVEKNFIEIGTSWSMFMLIEFLYFLTYFYGWKL